MFSVIIAIGAVVIAIGFALCQAPWLAYVGAAAAFSIAATPYVCGYYLFCDINEKWRTLQERKEKTQQERQAAEFARLIKGGK